MRNDGMYAPSFPEFFVHQYYAWERLLARSVECKDGRAAARPARLHVP